jgi:hypothetical protein
MFTRTPRLTAPLLGAIAATRAMLGAGAALLLAPRIREKRRRTLGWALLGVGVATTIPLAMIALRRRQP